MKNNLIDIKLKRELFELKLSDEDWNSLVTVYHNKYNEVVNWAKDNKIWNNNIEKIIVTNEYEKEIEKQAKDWGRKYALANEKKYISGSKILQNVSTGCLYIFFREFPYPWEEDLNRVIISQIITSSADAILPSEILEYKGKCSILLSDTVKSYLCIWCPEIYRVNFEKEIFGDKDSFPSSDDVFSTFSSKLKEILFKYNGSYASHEQRRADFWYSYKAIVSNLFIRLVEIKIYKDKIVLENSNYAKHCNLIVDEIQKIYTSFIKKESYALSSLTKLICNFSSDLGIYITDQKEIDKVHLKLTKNPKKYFKGELIDTEQRIVCFLDVLGFSEMVKEYDAEATCNYLETIQCAFNEAINLFLKGDLLQDKSILEYLEYKTFSDNIVISIPYFENPDDFFNNLNILTLFVRGMQYYFMSKNIFVRGGIALGSYYADNNMLFSQGMIKAYKLESDKAIYPRVILSKEIIDKLCDISNSQFFNQFFQKTFVIDNFDDVFISPFGQMKTNISQIVHSFDLLIDEKNDFLQNILTSVKEECISKLPTSEKTVIDEEILKLIFENKIKNKKIEKVYQKYMWLEDYSNWYFENNSRVNFKFLENSGSDK